MSGERILVVEDSAQMRDFLVEVLLPAEGYMVEAAHDGAEGLAAALANPPDLIITDLAMPNMDGLQMVEALRREGLRVPVILMTAEGSEALAVQALRLGVMDYFVKPFEPEELVAAVDRVLRASRIGAIRTGVPDQRRLRALNALIAVGKSVTSLLDLEMILSRVVEAAVYLTGAEEGSLMLVDAATGELYVRAAKNLQDGLRNMRLPVKDSLAGYVVRTGKPLLVGDKGPQKIKTQYLVQSLLYVPLKIGGQVIGVLGVFNRISKGVISQEDVGIIAALADYAAIAIANAQLYSQSEAERARLGRITRQTSDPLLVVDREGRVVLSNPAIEVFFDRAAGSNPTGRPLTELTSNPSLLNLLEYVLQGGLRRGEVQHNDGRIFNASVSEIEGIGYAITLQDVTHLKELDRVKTELLEMVSHQVRSPLTAILSYIELLQRTGNLSAQQLDFASQIRDSVRQIARTLDDLLNLSKIEAGLDRTQKPTSLAEAAQAAFAALHPQAELKHQHITLDIADPLPLVVGNPVQLQQMFVNLMENSIKYTPEGGTIHLRIFPQEGEVVACISDTGIGIPPEEQARVFEKFYRASTVSEGYEGTGLGLSIVKSIVDAHRGRIWLESRPGEGTTFTVVLPALGEEDNHATGNGVEIVRYRANRQG